MSDAPATTTGLVGLALATASGVVIFGLAEYGSGIDTAFLAAYGVATLAIGGLGVAIDALEWEVALPLGVVWVALVVIWWTVPTPPIPGLSMAGFVGLFLAAMGALGLLSMPVARRVEALHARAR